MSNETSESTASRIPERIVLLIRQFRNAAHWHGKLHASFCDDKRIEDASQIEDDALSALLVELGRYTKLAEAVRLRAGKAGHGHATACSLYMFSSDGKCDCGAYAILDALREIEVGE